MNGNSDYYNLYISEAKGEEFKLAWDKRKLYLFINSNNNAILSTNQIPNNKKYLIIYATISHRNWRLKIPGEYLNHQIDRRFYRYSLEPISYDKQTQQILQISPRLLIKESNNERITPLSKSGRAKAEKLKRRCDIERTQNGQNPNLFDTLQ